MLKRYLYTLVTPLALMAAPIAPSNLILTPHSHSVDISWVDNSQDESGFKIFRDGVLIHIVPENTTHYTDLGLQSARTYNYTIKATDDEKRIFILGSSTVHTANYISGNFNDPYGSNRKLEGWGEHLKYYMKDPSKVYNRARSGADSLTYRNPDPVHGVCDAQPGGGYLHSHFGDCRLSKSS